MRDIIKTTTSVKEATVVAVSSDRQWALSYALSLYETFAYAIEASVVSEVEVDALDFRLMNTGVLSPEDE